MTPELISMDAARYLCKQAFKTPHLNLILVTLGLAELGWAWEATGSADGLYVGVLGLPGESDEPERLEGRRVLASVDYPKHDLLPPLLQATAMALESNAGRR